MKDLLNNKVTKIICKITKWVFFIFVILFASLVYLQKFSNNELSILNHRMFTVITGSMEPRYRVGDVLFSRETPPEDIKVGDTISYKGARGDVKNKIVTHEVIKIDRDESGKYIFNTRGLTNLIQDPIVQEEQVLGVIVYKSKVLSFISKVIRTNIGFFMFIVLPIAGIITYELVSTLLQKEEKKRSL